MMAWSLIILIIAIYNFNYLNMHDVDHFTACETSTVPPVLGHSKTFV